MNARLSKEDVSKRIKSNFKQNVEVIGEYKNRRSQISLRCLECGHEWDIIASYVLYKENHECPNCGRHIKQNNIFYCANCGKEVIRKNSDIEKKYKW